MQRIDNDEHVILLDHRGRPSGTAAKRSVHSTHTPLHLGFSCHVVDGDGRVLLTQRAATKATWPGVWTNACCGHPQAGESLRDAVGRRLGDELGVTADRLGLAVSDFTYRAVMDNGVVEHEVCPVVIAQIAGEPRLNPDEVGDATWIDWETLRARARQQPASLSPWSVDQVARITAVAPSPWDWISQRDAADVPLDAPFLCPPAPPIGDEETTDPLDPIRQPVDELLREFVAARSAALAELDPSLADLGHEIGALIAAGGKRLRPAFVYWGHRASGADHHPGVAAVAGAVEMLHTFALLHDDVMDRSPTRRGRPAAQCGFASAHAADALGGDPAWFGTSAAILAGDLAFVWADELLDAAALPAVALARARQVFTALRTEVMAGQYLDLRLDGAGPVDEEAARRVALLKSGRYTVTRPLALGLALGTDRNGDRAAALAAYGDALGLAFQMRDDILGLFGDPDVTGKGSADDLRAGKRTVLVLRALALATPTQRRRLLDALGNPELDDAVADDCREIVAESGALASVETLVRERHDAARRALARVPEPARGALQALAADVVHRDS